MDLLSVELEVVGKVNGEGMAARVISAESCESPGGALGAVVGAALNAALGAVSVRGRWVGAGETLGGVLDAVLGAIPMAV